jgi:hypothetical protein
VEGVQKARRGRSGRKASKGRLVRRDLRGQPGPLDQRAIPVVAAKRAHLDRKVFPALRGPLARWGRKVPKESRETRGTRETQEARSGGSIAAPMAVVMVVAQTSLRFLHSVARTPVR